MDDDVTIHFNKCKRIINLVTHCPYEFYFKKNDLKLEEQYAIVEFHLSSPKQLLLDYCNKCKYITVKLMCGSWKRALFVRKRFTWIMDLRMKILWKNRWIRYPPFQAQKLVIGGA